VSCKDAVREGRLELDEPIRLEPASIVRKGPAKLSCRSPVVFPAVEGETV
jgi:hypothetical protein